MGVWREVQGGGQRLRGLLELVTGSGLLRAPGLTCFRLLTHTVSTKERAPRSRTRLWKAGGDRPRLFSVHPSGA